MKLSRTAIKELTAAYRAVLKRALVASMGLAMIAPAIGAERVLVDENELYQENDNATINISYTEVRGTNQNSPLSIIFVDRNKGELSVGDDSVFSDNLVDSGVFSTSKVGTILELGRGVVFDGNTARYDGGAIANFGLLQTSGGVVFKNNVAQTEQASNSNQIGGGAVALGSDSKTMLNGDTFIANRSGYNGGAIGTRRGDVDNSGGLLFIANSSFQSNIADGWVDDDGKLVAGTGNGGAIHNTLYKGDVFDELGVMISGSDFVSNIAKNDGGAIYNDGTPDKLGNGGRMHISGGTFNMNNAGRYGGAIFNSGEMTIDRAVFKNNQAYIGGGFFVHSGSKTTINSSLFEDNRADFGGAGYTTTNMENLEINNTQFKNNEAKGAGALGIFAKAQLNNVLFSGNKATLADEDGAGALFLGALSQVAVDNSEFSKNKSASVGGAIAMRAPNQAKNVDAKLDITNSLFFGNEAATNGGAIYSTFYNSEKVVDSVAISNTRFTSNKAENGGAIYNDGQPDKAGNLASMALADVTFTGNNAKADGGAIYNADGATINMTGTNMFSGNTRGTYASGQPNSQVANDIHNLGQLNILAGETTFASGVSGTGTLTLADGATMNIGTAKIEQGTLNIDGTVAASIVDSRSYGRLYADNYNIGKNGTLKLNVGAVGTYNIFNENAGDITIDAGLTYTATKNDDGSVLIETKALEDLAADTGLSTKAAGAVAGLANSADRSLSMLSLRVQNALDAGRVEYVEQEAGKLNPEEKPVAHSVAASVQNQIMNTLTNRMAALGAVGRNGGDVNAEYGFWAHGLINKSKYGSQFHGYTRGTAIGLDALINRAFTIGAGYAYAATDMHSHDRTTDIESNTFFVYGQYKPSKGYVNAALNYTKSEYEEHLSMFDLNFQSDHDVITYGGQVMTGYDFSVGLTPEVGLRYLHMSQDDYSNGLATVKGTDSDFVTGTAGMKYSFLIQDTGRAKWRPELRAAATYDFVSDDTAVTVTMPGAAPYIVDGDRLSRFGGEFGLGLSIECPGLTLTLSYDLDLHKDYTSQTGMAKLKLMF